MKIVITAPSLDEHKNVSGISTVVRQIIEHSGHNIIHFQAGRSDSDRSDVRWIAKQAFLPMRFAATISKAKAELVHINTALTDRSIWRDAALARFARKPIVLSIHGGRYLLEEIKSKQLKRAATSLLRAAKVVVVLSEFERQQVEQRWSGLDIRVLPNAVPAREGLISVRDNTTPVLLYIGRLHESKGLSILAEACKRLTDEGVVFQFRCFGEGPMRDEFIGSMNAILGDNFFYGGIVSGGEKLREYDNADIFVLPSIYGEGLPMAILEAMAAGCVVVASEMASVASVIKDGVNGYMVEPRNTAQLVARLKETLTDRSNLQSMREAAVETVRNDFAIDGYIAKLDAIYADASK